MKNRNKVLIPILLTAGATVGTILLNQYIKAMAIAKNLLSEEDSHCFKWKCGDIHYTKTGTGKPLLLIHDLDPSSSGKEWERLIPMLKEDYTVYSIDLLGCGRSEKPNLTYTNFLYVQLIKDFVQSEIKCKTNVIATGASAPLATMASIYNHELFDQIMFINPDSFHSCAQIPNKMTKIYKFILDTPIFGTLLYHIASAKNILRQTFIETYFCNPNDEKISNYIDKYYESAHLGTSPQALYSSLSCHYTKCNISRSLGKIDQPIYILGGAAEQSIDHTIQEYMNCNPEIQYSTIEDTKHLPQLEKPVDVYNKIKSFFM